MVYFSKENEEKEEREKKFRRQTKNWTYTHTPKHTYEIQFNFVLVKCENCLSSSLKSLLGIICRIENAFSIIWNHFPHTKQCAVSRHWVLVDLFAISRILVTHSANSFYSNIFIAMNVLSILIILLQEVTD